MLDFGYCRNHLVGWWNLNLIDNSRWIMHNSQWITIPAHSCLIVYSSCSSFLHLLHLFLLFIIVFHISISWWSFTGDWVTVNLLQSPGLFSVFWPFSVMLLFGWSPLGRQLPNLPGPIIIIIIIIIIILLVWQFSISALDGVFNLSLGDMSTQVSMMFRSILTNLNNTVVWMVPLFILFPSPLVPAPFLWWLVERANYHLFHRHFDVPKFVCFFVSSLERSRYLLFFSLSFSFTLLWHRPYGVILSCY